VNDTFGHLGGDEVLKNVSGLLGGQVRDSDVLGRYGGEEFIILAPETREEKALELSERLRAIVEETCVWFEDREICITISLGVVEYRDDIDSYLQMIHEADLALYHSKTHGRNSVSRYKNDNCERLPVPSNRIDSP
ncbi:MAG: GGDEF domain-containing protein, partial [Planctomycetes bacterium]|nr:GGDEF domain-containing protein [Planctomycetota bacterium]